MWNSNSLPNHVVHLESTNMYKTIEGENYSDVLPLKAARKTTRYLLQLNIL